MIKYNLNLDGHEYKHIGVAGLRRSAQIMEDGNSGWTLNGQYRRSIIGTLYSYSVTLYQLYDADNEAYIQEYDTVYDIITAPTSTHTLVVPYGQSTITLTVYITGVDDSLRWEDDNGRLWGAMQVKFQAQAPSRTGA